MGPAASTATLVAGGGSAAAGGDLVQPGRPSSPPATASRTIIARMRFMKLPSPFGERQGVRARVRCTKRKCCPSRTALTLTLSQRERAGRTLPDSSKCTREAGPVATGVANSSPTDALRSRRRKFCGESARTATGPVFRCYISVIGCAAVRCRRTMTNKKNIRHSAATRTDVAGVRIVPPLSRRDRHRGDKPAGDDRPAAKRDLRLDRKLPASDRPAPNPPCRLPLDREHRWVF